MFQVLRSYLTTLHDSVWFRSVTVRPHLTLTRTRSQVQSYDSSIDLDYTAVRKVVLIVDHENDGEENPVALAFVRTDGQLVVKGLVDLAEWE